MSAPETDALARRIAAIIALVAVVLTVALAVAMVIERFPRGLGVFCGLAIALVAGWFALVRNGIRRVIAALVAVLALAGAALLLLRDRGWLTSALLVAGVLVWHAAARIALRPVLRRPLAPPPRHPVLFVNPWSGDGKAARAGLAEYAAALGIDTVEMRIGDDLADLVRAAIAAGADGLAAAGGDGTQAVIATAAAEYGLPFACVPAGTRNHFALDLGVDRDDIRGALHALVEGGEHRVDLGEVNGRVFVNNVSMGLYAEAVRRPAYRDAKIKTLLDTAATLFGGAGAATDLRWTAPDGAVHASAAAILVSNNPYRLGEPVGPGTRPRLDTGRLGVAVIADDSARRARERRLRRWDAVALEVRAARPVSLGIDGESVVLEPPLRFRIRPRALRVRVSPRHPGASPSVLEQRPGDGLRALTDIAIGREPRIRR